MTQRQVDHATPLPACRQGHPARHILDCRRASAGGGHFVECSCSVTSKHADFEAALQDWKRQNRIRTPRKPRAIDNCNVLQFGLFAGGAKPR